MFVLFSNLSSFDITGRLQSIWISNLIWTSRLIKITWFTWTSHEHDMIITSRCKTWPWLVDAVALATAGHLRAVVPEAVLFARSAAEVQMTDDELRPVTCLAEGVQMSSDCVYIAHHCTLVSHDTTSSDKNKSQHINEKRNKASLPEHHSVTWLFCHDLEWQEFSFFSGRIGILSKCS